MQQQTATKAPPRKAVGAGNVFVSFLPWIIFGVVAGPSTWKYAALAALAASLLVSGRDLTHRQWNVLDVTGIVFFAVLCVLALVLDRHTLIWVETYAQVIASLAVAVVALGSLAFDPFTAQYARRGTPPHLWNTPVFKHVNVVLTAMWGGVFLVMAVLSWLAIRFPSASDWCNWVVPAVLLVWAVKFTERYPEAYKEKVLR
ncbi:hypothetical protein ABZ858_17030 [Streptomyces sp. NPDC047017]|uniref:hypothetical protein n=1 Tax=Streptomyces sp. NPDC047017 TaxID=3155024 RepID=UPI0033DA7E73